MAYKMKGFSGFKSSPTKQKVDPDAPGTPGQPGYEPPVKREDLDEKGKAIWDRLRKIEERSQKLEERSQKIQQRDSVKPDKAKKDSPAKISSSELREAVGKVSKVKHKYRQKGWAKAGAAILGKAIPTPGMTGGGGSEEEVEKEDTSSEKVSPGEDKKTKSVDEILQIKLSGLGKKWGLQNWKDDEAAQEE